MVQENPLKKKYLFLMRTGGYAGAEQVQMDYMRHIDYKYFSALLGVIRDKDFFSSRLEEENLPVEIVFLPAQRQSEKFLSEFSKYLRFFRSLHPDCIVCNQFFLNSFSLAETTAAFLATRGEVYNFVHDCPPLPFRQKGGQPLGLERLEAFSWRLERLSRTALGFLVKRTIAVSEASKRTLVTLHHFPASRVKVVHHGVDRKRYVPAEKEKMNIRQRLDIDPGDTVIISTARLQYPKRVGWLIEAFSREASERKDLLLLIAGVGEEQKWLLTLARSLEKNTGSRIRFLGFREDVPMLLQASDIYVLPSETEGLSIACMEAMACGLVCVVTDVGGMLEIIKDGVTGFLVTKSREGVREGLQKALALSPAEREELIRNARKFIAENFDVEVNIRAGLQALGITTQ